jgi:hypothetical protein
VRSRAPGQGSGCGRWSAHRACRDHARP